MKLSQEIVERAARALADTFERATAPPLDEAPAPWDELGDHARELAREMSRAALEAALRGCTQASVRGKVGEVATLFVSHDLAGKRVALVPVED